MITRQSWLASAIAVHLLFTTTLAARPADYLMPPPPSLSVAQHLMHVSIPTTLAGAAAAQPAPSGDGNEPPGFMTRIARWFGFGSNEASLRHQQQLNGDDSYQQTGNSFAAATNHAYVYGQQKLQHYAQSEKSGDCGLCGKYPWIPMLPSNIQRSLSQQLQERPLSWSQGPVQQEPLESQASPQHASKSVHQLLPLYLPVVHQQQQQAPPKDRVIRFRNLPVHNKLPPRNNGKIGSYVAATGSYPPIGVHFVPIHLSTLSSATLPGVYDPQLFRSINSATTVNKMPTPSVEQQLPSTQLTHFIENVGAHSEFQPASVRLAQASTVTYDPNNNDESSVEVVKSKPVAEYVSSVEYPATYVPSHTVDVSKEQPSAGPKDIDEQTSTADGFVAHGVTASFHHVGSAHRLPASHIITDLEAPFANSLYPQPEETTSSPGLDLKQTTLLYPQQFAPFDASTPEHYYDTGAADNFPSASSHNFSAIRHQNHVVPLTNWADDNFATLQANEFLYSTPLPQVATTTLESTPSGLTFATDFVTEPPLAETTADVKALTEERDHFYAIQAPRITSRDRETPKRFLDAPIQHSGKVTKDTIRHFTRDPSELNYRLGAVASQPFQHHNHAYTEVTTTTVLPPATEEPAPISRYGALDASGQYANISPPAPKRDAAKMTYMIKNRPRPFRPQRLIGDWSDGNGADIHEQQESKVIVATTTNTPTAKVARPTKYLTRILASNFRDQEQMPRNRTKAADFDISKLQKNIDGWTEQEFTSLSHRPSTPTIHGRSKHIPTEYLTTTRATPRQAKTTSRFDPTELSQSINNLETLLVNRGSKRFQYEPIDDNRILEHFDAIAMKRRTPTTIDIGASISTTTISSPITTTTTTRMAPFYARAIGTTTTKVAELWQKARVSISPQTKEKVYVVTPQPRLYPQYLMASTTVPTLERKRPSGNVAFKSPRFAIRPTPANGTAIYATKSTESYSPDLFGLMGLSSHVPAQPVEIIDGNSKVLRTKTHPLS